MMDIILGVLSTIGAIVILIAAVGIVRMPDFYLRLSVTVKAATLGNGVLLLCAAMVFPYTEVPFKALAIVFFLLLTAPVAAHMIGRRAFRSNIAIWEDTWIDELEDKYSYNRKSVQKEEPSGEHSLDEGDDEGH